MCRRLIKSKLEQMFDRNRLREFILLTRTLSNTQTALTPSTTKVKCEKRQYRSPRETWKETTEDKNRRRELIIMNDNASKTRTKYLFGIV